MAGNFLAERGFYRRESRRAGVLIRLSGEARHRFIVCAENLKLLLAPREAARHPSLAGRVPAKSGSAGELIAFQF